jgi:hypothetical protein
MYITVVGGGNSTAIFATLALDAGHQVAILTRRPEAWSDVINFVNDDKGWLDIDGMEGRPTLITADAAECIPHSDAIFIAGIPIHHNPAILKQIKPHLDKSKCVAIGSVCAYGGFNWVAQKALGDANYALFGTNLIPWTCGTDVYGKTGHIFGVKRILRCVTEGGSDKHNIKSWMQPILRQNLVDCDFLTSTLWPNNPSLHPPILYGLFKDWDGKSTYNKSEMPSKIYADLTPESAKCVVELDNDFVAIHEALRKVFPDNVHLKHDLSLKACILENYEDQVTDPSTTVTCVNSNIAFASHYLQWTEVEEGKLIPVINHKFFETDLPYGLCTFKDMANSLNVHTPMLDAILEWNQRMIGKEYMVDGKLTGKDCPDAIIPSMFGFGPQDLADQQVDRSVNSKI